jgi:hypothetical protein
MAKMIDPNKLLDQTTSIMIIDLLEHAMSVTSELHLNALVAPPAGLYMSKTMTPFMWSDREYYLRSKYHTEAGRIHRLDDVLCVNEDIVDAHGATVITAAQLAVRKRYIRLEPDIPVTAMEMVLVLINDYLNAIAPYARTLPSKRQESYVRPEYWHLIDAGIYEDVFEPLLDQIFSFVGSDTWHIYFTRLKGSVLVIEKVIDYRIYRYHELQHLEHLALEEGF